MVTTVASGLMGLAAAGLALGAVGAVYQRVGEARDRRRWPAPGRLVDVGGRGVHVLVSGGSGRPVVVHPACGDLALAWVRVQRALAELTDAAVYVIDRPGLGWSDPAPWPRTPTAMAAETRMVIQRLGIEDPVVLVGHSMGGLVARTYAVRYPGQVAHLVLVDSTHEDQISVLHSVDPTYSAARMGRRALRQRFRVLSLRRMRAAWGDPELRATAEAAVPEEWVEAYQARTLTAANRRAVVRETVGGVLWGRGWVRTHARDLGDLPLTVVTAGSTYCPAWYPRWLDLQADLATLSTNSHIVRAAPEVGHLINRDAPDWLATVLATAIDNTRETGVGA